MQAHKLAVEVPEDHKVELRLPREFPAGPAEVIVLASEKAVTTEPERPGQAGSLRAAEILRSLQLTTEERRILDEFEGFRRSHPLRLGSSSEP